MTFKPAIGFTALMLAFGSFAVHAASPYPIWHDTASIAVTFDNPTCFIGIVHGAYSDMYNKYNKKHRFPYLYIHLQYPVNVFPNSTRGDLWNSTPVGHQYDFQMVFTSKKMVFYTEKLVGKTLRVIGSIASPVTPRDAAPPSLNMTILKIDILNPSIEYKSVCHDKN